MADHEAYAGAYADGAPPANVEEPAPTAEQAAPEAHGHATGCVMAGPVGTQGPPQHGFARLSSPSFSALCARFWLPLYEYSRY